MLGANAVTSRQAVLPHPTESNDVAPPADARRLAVLVLLPSGSSSIRASSTSRSFAPAARLSRGPISSFWRAGFCPRLPHDGILAGHDRHRRSGSRRVAFLVVRTDLPAKRLIEPALPRPIVLSPIVIAFGYVVAVGPVGFASLAFKALIGFVP